jgi:hypothetical protein
VQNAIPVRLCGKGFRRANQWRAVLGPHTEDRLVVLGPAFETVIDPAQCFLPILGQAVALLTLAQLPLDAPSLGEVPDELR